uniref:Secreted protein n=1 Tax=Panagrellus redivivus TaxID=6233 RepID=A0A7E4VUH9_PANRE
MAQNNPYHAISSLLFTWDVVYHIQHSLVSTFPEHTILPCTSDAQRQLTTETRDKASGKHTSVTARLHQPKLVCAVVVKNPKNRRTDTNDPFLPSQ